MYYIIREIIFKWGELPFSLKDTVFKTQGLKNSKSFLAVPPLPPMLFYSNFQWGGNCRPLIFQKFSAILRKCTYNPENNPRYIG